MYTNKFGGMKLNEMNKFSEKIWNVKIVIRSNREHD